LVPPTSTPFGSLPWSILEGDGKESNSILIQSGIGRLIQKIAGETWNFKDNKPILNGAQSYTELKSVTEVGAVRGRAPPPHRFTPEEEYYIYFGVDKKKQPSFKVYLKDGSEVYQKQAWVELVVQKRKPETPDTPPSEMRFGKRWDILNNGNDVELRDSATGHWLLGRQEFTRFCRLTNETMFNIQTVKREIISEVAVSVVTDKADTNDMNDDARGMIANQPMEFEQERAEREHKRMQQAVTAFRRKPENRTAVNNSFRAPSAVTKRRETAFIEEESGQAASAVTIWRDDAPIEEESSFGFHGK
jgi:hypothetical protein